MEKEVSNKCIEIRKIHFLLTTRRWLIKVQMITPSDAVIIECKLGIESALSIFTITCISAPWPAKRI